MDKYLLIYEMRKSHISRQELCAKIGMSMPSFSKKINGKVQFTLDEIKAIMKALNISDPRPIFFTEEVS